MKRDCFSDVVASSCFRFLELELPPLAFVLDEVDAEEVEFEFVPRYSVLTPRNVSRDGCNYRGWPSPSCRMLHDVDRAALDMRNPRRMLLLQALPRDLRPLAVVVDELIRRHFHGHLENVTLITSPRFAGTALRV